MVDANGWKTTVNTPIKSNYCLEKDEAVGNVRNPAFDWDKLCDEQSRLAFDLVKIGDNLVLPGDDDWIDPSPGMEDFTSVSQRQ